MNLASLRFLRAAGLALLISCGCGLGAQAGPPQVSDPNTSSNWLAPLSPTNWKMPALRWPTMNRQPSNDKSPGVMANMSQSLGRSWQKTKQTLNPKNLLPSSEKPKPSTRKAKKDSVWSGWFTPKEEPQKIETINDYLRQPSPY